MDKTGYVSRYRIAPYPEPEAPGASQGHDNPSCNSHCLICQTLSVELSSFNVTKLVPMCRCELWMPLLYLLYNL